MGRLRSISLLLLMTAAPAILPPAAGAALPVPRALAPMVAFWRDVFTKHSTSEVVFHDEEDLQRIYGTLDLGAPWTGTRAQSRAIRARKERIESVLRALASGRALPAADRGLAERLRKVLAGRPREEVRRAAFLVRAQPGLRERFRESYVRSGRYLPHFRRIFRKHGVPEDLTLLPHVESGFRSAVYSKARALGMWQFTRGTGRLFMRVDSAVDGRRDPFLAAEAAARLLRQNYDELGSWPLAITAYNHGVQGMRRAVERVGSRDIAAIVERYEGRYFGFASRNFYAEFIASVEVHKNARRHFGDVRPEPPLAFDEVALPFRVPLAELSRRIGVPKEELKRLNPALRPRVLRGARSVPRGYPLRVPAGAGARARGAVFEGGRIRVAGAGDASRWIVVRPGDTLSHIARRHRVGLDALIDVNEIEGHIIHPGERLLLPGGPVKRAAARPPASPAKPPPQKAPPPPVKEAAARPAPEVAKAEAPAPPRKAAPAAARARAAAPAPPEAAREAPRLPVSSPKAPPPGPGKKPAAKEAPAPKAKEAAPPRLGEDRRRALAVDRDGDQATVVVQEGETISHFAGWLGVEPAALRRLNHLGRGRSLRLGQRLRLPLDGKRIAGFEERRLSFHNRQKRDFARKFEVTGTVRHRLRPRQNVWTLITRTYNLPLWLVRDFNPGVDLRRVAAGDELVFPVVRRR